jgi:hypothetical protein
VAVWARACGQAGLAVCAGRRPRVLHAVDEARRARGARHGLAVVHGERRALEDEPLELALLATAVAVGVEDVRAAVMEGEEEGRDHVLGRQRQGVLLGTRLQTRGEAKATTVAGCGSGDRGCARCARCAARMRARTSQKMMLAHPRVERAS